jgi:hypothetical protein
VLAAVDYLQREIARDVASRFDALRTRFIPDAITDHFEQCAWPAPTRESSSLAAAALKTVPIGARLKQMWR